MGQIGVTGSQQLRQPQENKQYTSNWKYFEKRIMLPVRTLFVVPNADLTK